MTNGTGIFTIGLLVALAAGACASAARADTDLQTVLESEYSLAAERNAETRYYELQTRVVNFAPDGQVSGQEVYRLLLSETPAPAGEDIDAQYRCREFTVAVDDDPPLRLSALDGWSYPFTLYPAEGEETRPPLGIPHEPFVDLTDGEGQPLQPSVRYAIYNSFIDFHGLCDLLARPTAEGKGVQDLTRIGQRVVHVAAFTEAPIDLGEVIGKGSEFKNGEITLEFRGISSVDGVPCALMAYDSGEASFNMTLKPMPNMEITVVGRSHFLGELFIELDSGWVRKASLNEVVVAQVTAGGKTLDTSTSERSLTIRLLTEEQFAGR
jgi:hypothetical protein